MAKHYIIQRHKEVDRRAGLFALSADDGNIEESACLTDEELTALVDGVCSKEERERFFQHLAYCEICYQHWVELAGVATVEKAQEAGKNVHKFFRPRHFAWAGSFFAAAASVVLFLNITRETPPPVLHRTMPTTVEHKGFSSSKGQKDTEAVNSMSMPAEQKVEGLRDAVEPEMKLKNAPPFPASAGKKIDAVHREYSRVKSLAGKEKTAPEELQADKSGRGLTTTRLMQNKTAVYLWLEHIRQGCRALETDDRFWKKQFRDGQQITHFKSTEEEQLVKELLPILDTLQEKAANRPALCEQILRHLETAPVE